MHKLVISDDEGKTTVVPLVREEISIGRKEGNTIRLTERNVSRKHAKLLRANGAFVVEDLNSYNGVSVNGRKIEGRVNLKAGDQLGIGDYVLALQSDVVAEAPTAAVPGAPGSDAATAMIAAPTEPRPPARLVMLTPPAPGAEFALSRERQRVGRAEDLPIWVNHRSISREHAEIVREGNNFRVVDLGSANGVRLNGKDTRDAPLAPGDVIELGQVRFRYVGEGEAYVFDADSTIQMEPITGPAPVSRAPIFAALGIIAAAVLVAAVLALGGEEEDPGPTITRVTSTTGNGTGVVAEPAANVDEAVEECRAALRRLEAGAAVAAAASALSAEPGHADATACRNEAQPLVRQEEVYRAGLEALEASDLEGAATAFANLPEQSPYRERPEVARANSAYGSQAISAARAALDEGDLETANDYADRVLTTSGMSDEHQRQATAIKNEVTAASVVAVAPDATQVEPDRPPDRNPQRNMNPVMRPDRDMRPPAMDPVEMAPSGNPLMECTSEANYNRCILQRLRRPSTPREYEALINAYKETGQRNRACELMRQVIQRYPSSSTARRFDQYVQRQCR